MNFTAQGASGAAAQVAVQRMHLKKIEKGIVPLLNWHVAELAPEKKLPWIVKNHWATQVIAMLILFGTWAASPFLFHYIQEATFKTSDSLFFQNNVTAVMSIFPGFLLAFIVTSLIHMFLERSIPFYREAAGYSSIIQSNRIYYSVQKGNEKQPNWKNIITKEQVEKVLQYDNKQGMRWFIVCLLLMLPLYYACFFTYRNVTAQTWTESFVGMKKEFQISQVRRVDARLELKESSSRNSESKLDTHMTIEIYFPGEKSPFEVCTPACFYDHEQVKELIRTIKTDSKAVFKVKPLPKYVREFANQDNDGYLVDVYDVIAAE